jgi:hypothetical protein
MPFILDFSRFNLTRRRENTGTNTISGFGDFMYALGDESGPQYPLADDTYTEDGNLYTELLGWRVGDYARVSQPVAAVVDNGVQFECLLQVIDRLPAGLAWVFQVLRDTGLLEEEVFVRRVTRRRKRFTVRLPASEAIGGILIFQLKLVAV